MTSKTTIADAAPPARVLLGVVFRIPHAFAVTDRASTDTMKRFERT